MEASLLQNNGSHHPKLKKIVLEVWQAHPHGMNEEIKKYIPPFFFLICTIRC